ncbi:hypothetical protein ACNRWW_13985 [Metabacillus sp. HB246100]
MDWKELIEQLEKEGITAKEANTFIRGYQMVKSVMKSVEELDRNN